MVVEPNMERSGVDQMAHEEEIRRRVGHQVAAMQREVKCEAIRILGGELGMDEVADSGSFRVFLIHLVETFAIGVRIGALMEGGQDQFLKPVGQGA